MHNRYFSFCFQFELLEGEPCYLALYRQRTEKGCFVMYFIHLKHMLALFMTSLLHPAGHKMAALPVLLSCLSSFFLYFFIYYYYFLTNENQMTKKTKKIKNDFLFLMLIQKLYIKKNLNIWTNMMLLRFSSSLNIMHQSITIFLCLSAMFLLLFWPNDVAVDHFYNYIEGIFGFLSSSIHSTNENGKLWGFGNRWWHNPQYSRHRLRKRRLQPG